MDKRQEGLAPFSSGEYLSLVFVCVCVLYVFSTVLVSLRC